MVATSGPAVWLVLSATYLCLASCAVLELPIWFRNSYALVRVMVGTPAQQYYLRFDSGSASTWIVDQECADSTCNNYSDYARTGYNVASSATGQSLGTYGSISYLGGVTAGPGVADMFSFPSSPDVQWNQSFIAANRSSWSNLPADGFLGMAFSSIAEAGTTTLVETLMQAGELDEPRFSIYYGHDFDDTSEHQGDGVVLLGGSDEDKYVDGDLTWIEPLQTRDGQHQLWRTNMVSFSAQSPSADAATDIAYDSSWAVFDTGAGGPISIPESQADAVYASIGMNYTAIISGEHIPLCTEFTSDWSVSFRFGDYENPVNITLTGDQLALPGFADGSPEYCWPPFSPLDSDGLWLFGTAFLHQLYSVFDFGAADVASYNPRVGFGQLKAEYRP